MPSTSNLHNKSIVYCLKVLTSKTFSKILREKKPNGNEDVKEIKITVKVKKLYPTNLHFGMDLDCNHQY